MIFCTDFYYIFKVITENYTIFTTVTLTESGMNFHLISATVCFSLTFQLHVKLLSNI